MVKEQLDKNFYCGLKQMNFNHNNWVYTPCFKTLEKATEPEYPIIMRLFSHINYKYLDISNPSPSFEKNHNLFLARCLNNPFGQVKITNLSLARSSINR